MKRYLFAAAAMFAAYAAGASHAHDTWVQTNANLVRTGDVVHVSLMLGNHGNNHRDFKLASKLDLAGSSLAITDPKGNEYDLIGELADLGYAPKEGFWAARFVPGTDGLHAAVHLMDRVVSHGRPIRAIKSAKTYFAASKSLDNPSPRSDDFRKPLGHPLELVLETDPIASGPGCEVGVRLLFQGEPMEGAVVSFIPRGVRLSDDFDPEYERKTDETGSATFVPKEGNYYLIVAHHRDDQARSEDYDATAYSATMTLYVPQSCPCCDQ